MNELRLRLKRAGMCFSEKKFNGDLINTTCIIIFDVDVNC